MTELRVPDPSLVVLIGPAGAGKSTLARRLFHPTEILSSDAIRAAISGDEADQSVSRAAFAVLHHELARRLADGRLTVVDATNLTAAGRRPLLRRAEAAGVPAVAIVLALPADVVRARNGRRARVVDPGVVDRHLARVRSIAELGPERLRAEGFTAVTIVRSTDEADRLTVIRVASAGARHPSEGPSPQLHPDTVAQVDVAANDVQRGLCALGPDQEDRR